MNPGDIIVIIVVLVGVFFALRHVFRRRKSGGCCGCSSCSGCSGCSGCSKKCEKPASPQR